MDRLSPDTLGRIAAVVETPRYNRTAVQAGILHLGVGAFHRAHQAVFTEIAMNNSGGDWGIVGVSMRSDTVARQLHPQGGLYSVLSEDGGSRRLQVVGAIQQTIVAPQEPEALDRAIADPAIRVITLTITEKGYCLGGNGWRLGRNLPAVQQDIANPAHATTAIGLLARGLEKRLHNGAAPLSIISCDNVSENSARLRRVLVEYLQATYPDVLPWLDEAVSFPCSMVDRIVPAMTGEGRNRQADLLGLRDEAAVTTEPFSQWIIEDCFAAPVPDWRSAGVRYVADIKPFEAIKLRLLNATHSAIAYTGLLTGTATVAEVVSDPRLRAYVTRLMSGELMPALQVPVGFNLADYGDQLLQRFANPCLLHRCSQIAMDGTEKIPLRWLQTLRMQPGDSLLLRALGAWCYYILQTGMEISDPRQDELLLLRDSDAPLAVRLEALLGTLNIDRVGEPLCGAWLAYIEQYWEQLDTGQVPELLLAQTAGA